MAAHPQIKSPLPVQCVQSPLTQKLESQGCSWVSIGMTLSLGCLSLPDIFTYDENTRLVMSKQDLCDSSGLWITTLTRFPSGSNSRVGASKAVFMQSHFTDEMPTWEPCPKISVESHTFTSGHMNKWCPEGDSPSNGSSLAAAQCSHPRYPSPSSGASTESWYNPEGVTCTPIISHSILSVISTTQKTICRPHSKASLASSSLQVALWK